MIIVNLPVLQEIVDRAGSLARRLDDQVDAVDARARRVRSAWSGAAADEYAVAHAAWTAGARETHAALAVLRRIVATAHGNYAQAVAANRTMWP